MTEVLLVDDERVIRARYAEILSGEGYAVRTARDGVEALQKFAERRADLVILDVAMPRMNGFAACAALRKLDADVPVIFLTANASEVNEVRGLDAGADDFIAKDASESVLLARVRRAASRLRAPSAAEDEILVLGKVRVNLSTLEVKTSGGTEILTQTEADLLRVFAAERGRFLSADELITALRGKGFACEDSMLYAHVSHLRRKLAEAGEMLVSRRGSGYRLVQ